jgi:hypothetical protein
MSGKENRRASRSKHDSVLEIYDAEGHFIVGVGRLVNFSKVGVCFSSTKDLAKGDRLRSRIRLLKHGALDISARVMWVKKRPNTNYYGLEFDSVQKLRPD